MESLFREFDDVLFKKAVSENRLGLLDASSLLWRLNIMGVEVGEERWKKVTDALSTHIGNHRSPWLVRYMQRSRIGITPSIYKCKKQLKL